MFEAPVSSPAALPPAVRDSTNNVLTLHAETQKLGETPQHQDVGGGIMKCHWGGGEGGNLKGGGVRGMELGVVCTGDKVEG